MRFLPLDRSSVALLDSLTQMRRISVILSVLTMCDFSRSEEYDTLSNRYARFVIDEVLAEVGKEYSITDDPEGRATCGLSSGAISAR